MKVLVISNFYPPEVYGGYEIGCAQVVDGLRERGVEVVVLTSPMKGAETKAEQGVRRSLSNSFGVRVETMGLLKRLCVIYRHEYHNRQEFYRVVRQEQPDVIYFWNLGYLSYSLLEAANLTGIPSALFMFDYGYRERDTDLWNRFQCAETSGVKILVRRVMAACMKAQTGYGQEHLSACPEAIHSPTRYIESKYVDTPMCKAKWLSVSWGVDSDLFCPSEEPQALSRLLFVGQVSEHKGVHLVVEAIGMLKEEGVDDVCLTIVGRCVDDAYRLRLQELADKFEVLDNIEYIDFVDNSELPELYRRHGVFLFPSQWDEPMGIALMEAMACGLCVISSGTGGSSELYEEGKTGLSFRSGDSRSLADVIGRVIGDKAFAEQLSVQARKAMLVKDFRKHTVTTIENALKQQLN